MEIPAHLNHHQNTQMMEEQTHHHKSIIKEHVLKVAVNVTMKTPQFQMKDQLTAMTMHMLQKKTMENHHCQKTMVNHQYQKTLDIPEILPRIQMSVVHVMKTRQLWDQLMKTAVLVKN